MPERDSPAPWAVVRRGSSRAGRTVEPGRAGGVEFV